MLYNADVDAIVGDVTSATVDELGGRIEALTQGLEATTKALVATTQERDSYKRAYEAVLLELERWRRQLFGRKGERVDPAQVSLLFEPFRKLIEEAERAAVAESERQQPETAANAPAAPPSNERRKPTPHGRRSLDDMDHLPVEEIDLGAHVALPEGAKRIGEDVSYQVEFKRAHYVRLRIIRPRWVVPTGDDITPTTVQTAPAPETMMPGGIAGPALLAHVITKKYADQTPYNRLEKILDRDGFSVDRGTMCRWTQDCHQLARHVVAAMEQDARDNALVMATDATGVLVQNPEQCKRGHFWVTIADRDHVFFRYTANRPACRPRTRRGRRRDGRRSLATRTSARWGERRTRPTSATRST